MIKKILPILMTALVMTACSSMSDDCDDPMMELKEAAASVNAHLTKLAAIENASTPEAGPDLMTQPVIPGLMRMGSIDWYGPVEPLINKIAAAGGFKVRVLGIEPAVPIIVAIDARDVPLATILRDASFQAAKKAKIVAYPESKTIELRYFHA